MADQDTTVRHSFEDDLNTDPQSYAMPKGGVFVCDTTLNAGTGTFTLKTRVKADGTWVTAKDKEGNDITKDMDSSDSHWPIRLLAHGGQEFFLDPESGASLNADTIYGRVGN